jgi:hypothetical protein
MADTFISFIHEEAGYAQAVQIFLTQIFETNVRPFLSSDRFQVYAGDKWLDRIMDELQAAKVVILMLSEESVRRPWVNFEAGAAWTRGIATIPVCYGKLQKEGLPKPYSSLQGVDLEARASDEYLARSVAHHLGLKEPITRMTAAISALGGPEYKLKCERAALAYDRFQENLIKLKADPAANLGGGWDGL